MTPFTKALMEMVHLRWHKLFKKGDIGYSYIIMIALGILGIILILWIFKGGFGQLGSKLVAVMNQTQP